MYTEFGGNTPCIELSLTSSKDIVVLDSGTGIRNLGIELMQTLRSHSYTIHLFLTHAHWDHIQGFPFFAPLFESDFTLHIYCTKDAKHILGTQMSPPFFPVQLHSVSSTLHFHQLTPGCYIEVGKAKITHIPLPHPQGSTAFRIDEGQKSIVFATDTEHNSKHINAQLVEFSQDTDVLVYDAQYTDEEYHRKIGWGHSTYSEAIRLAKAANIGQLILYSHEPTHDDKTLRRIEASARDQFSQTIAARDGMVLDIQTKPRLR